MIDKPIANGAEPLISERRSSHTPCTTNTNMYVINASIITAWIGSNDGFNVVLPKLPFKILSGVANYQLNRKKKQKIIPIYHIVHSIKVKYTE